MRVAEPSAFATFMPSAEEVICVALLPSPTVNVLPTLALVKVAFSVVEIVKVVPSCLIAIFLPDA